MVIVIEICQIVLDIAKKKKKKPSKIQILKLSKSQKILKNHKIHFL